MTNKNTNLNNVVKCLNPNCSRNVRVRGLCSACYLVAHNLILSGQTTWAELESLGKSRPPKKLSSARSWLLNKQ